MSPALVRPARGFESLARCLDSDERPFARRFVRPQAKEDR